MAASRSSSIRALRKLSRSSGQVRSLHITGAAEHPTWTLAPDSARRAGQPQKEAALNKSAAKDASRPAARQFNTSRALKAPKDTSTVDLAFLPDADISATSDMPQMRVPLLHHNYDPPRTGVHSPMAEQFDNVVKPTIATVAAASTHVSIPSAMHEVHDNSAARVDFHEVAEKLNSTAAAVGEGVRGEAQIAGGSVSRIWKGLMDDVFGPQQKPAV